MATAAFLKLNVPRVSDSLPPLQEAHKDQQVGLAQPGSYHVTAFALSELGVYACLILCLTYETMTIGSILFHVHCC